MSSDHLNVKMFYQYRNSHYKDNRLIFVMDNRLIFVMEIPIHGKTVFILRRGSGGRSCKRLYIETCDASRSGTDRFDLKSLVPETINRGHILVPIF